MSDLLLQIVAIRLAALVLAGLLLQALPAPHHARSPMPSASLQRHASAPDPAIARTLHDMRLHD